MMANGMKQSLIIMKGAENEHVNQLNTLEKEIKNLSARIKTDRQDRRKVETSADTYWGWVEMLNDEKYRMDESYKAELGRIAQEKAREDLMELTEYVDGTVDYPLLSAETMEKADGHNN
jgi:hypothetical protein